MIYESCDVPPDGWVCTRLKGHGGPCAAYPTDGAEDVADIKRVHWALDYVTESSGARDAFKRILARRVISDAR